MYTTLARTFIPYLLILAMTLAPRCARAESKAVADRIGTTIELPTFADAAGKQWSMADARSKKAVAVVFLSFECPVSNSYAPILTDLARSYEKRGLALIGVSPGDTPAEAARHAAEFKLPFPIYSDPHGQAQKALAATVTPEAFVLDAKGILRYRGRIDDSYYARLKKKPNAGRQDLRLAIDEVLADKKVNVPSTEAVGCTIATPAPAKIATGNVTYHRDVLPILQKHCQTCHRPGEVGPFSLMNYRQAVIWSADIKEFAQARKMPPWKPVAGPRFHDERKMSDKEIATLAAWVDNGTPEGDAKEAPPPRAFAPGWQMGKPDLVLTVPEEFHLGASGNDVFRCFVLPTNLPEDRYVTAVEVRPGNAKIVHHALMFVDNAGQGRKLEDKEKAKAKSGDEPDRGPGYSVKMGVGFLPQGTMGGWAPGQMPRRLPEGTGYYLPKGADVVVQLHYHRDGRPETDRTSIGLFFADKPVQKRYQSIAVPGRFFVIPANDDSHKVTGSVWLKNDCEVHSVLPHMHMLGKEIKVSMTPPGGPTQTLVAIADWDYNWQETYFFEKAIPAKAGTRFDIEAVYDNSAGNPRNPNQPPRPVFFGEQTTNEMCFGFVGATADQPGRIRVERRDPNKQ